jgi:hypothetical protein
MKGETKKAPVAETHSPSFSSLLLGWAQQGFDSFLATQKILMDFATGKGAGAMDILREGIADSEHSPVAILTELAVEATANLTEAQRILLNLAQEENEIVMKGVKERVSGSATAFAVAERVRQVINTFVEMEQDYLTTASKHMNKRLEATKGGKGPDIACLVNAARDGMEDYVRAQKKFLDVVVSEGAKTKAGKAEEHVKKTEVTKLAREAAESFIEAQKKLLDLAGQQVNVSLQSASQAAEMLDELRPRIFPKVTSEEVKDFVEAEKALITSIIKPGEAAKTAKAARPAKRAARRRTTAPKAQAAASAGV